MIVLCLLLTIPSFAIAQCYTLVEQGVDDKNIGQLCFEGSSSSVQYHQYVAININRNGVQENFNYFGLGVSSHRYCVHTKEGYICHDHLEQTFGYDLGFGRVAQISLDLPDLTMGRASLPDGLPYKLRAQ